MFIRSYIIECNRENLRTAFESISLPRFLAIGLRVNCEGDDHHPPVKNINLKTPFLAWRLFRTVMLNLVLGGQLSNTWH